MALYLCLNKDGTSAVTNDNPISTKHTNAGNSQIVEVYIANDGKRKGVNNDTDPPPLIYTNIEIRVEGVSHKLATAIAASPSITDLKFDSVEGWNIGTIITEGPERMKITAILSNTSVRVQRNYDIDGKDSAINTHPQASIFVADATSVALALPSPSESDTNGPFEAGGASISKGLDPSMLTRALTAAEDSNILRSNKPTLYHLNSLIKINDEIMKITDIKANGDITVIRGCENTIRTAHNVNDTIYCVGIVDKKIGHKFYIKNTPPPGLPTQKKSDIKIVLMSDEEPQ